MNFMSWRLVILIGVFFTASGMLFGQKSSDMRIVYIGDPMCSWCYGISNNLTEVVSYFEDRNVGIKVVTGGLRPGGGDEWNDDFTNFLKHHWEEVSKRSGMPFKYDLLNTEDFNYDTGPACRAVVVARSIKEDIALDFFKLTQKKFYFENKDPKDVEFYQSICENLDIEFSDFQTKFQSDAFQQKTEEDFNYARKIGVRSFPTILFEKNGQLFNVAAGYAESNQMIRKIQEIIEREN